MLQELIFSGIGGQGAQSIGKLLANAANKEGKEVMWRPAFRGQMRGGISNCIISICDGPITSPISNRYDAAIVLNGPALKHYEQLVKAGGILVWECTNTREAVTRDDIRIYALPAYQKATVDLKNAKVMNMIMLGALLKIYPLVQIETVIAELKETIPARHHDLLQLDEQAIELGMSLIP
ncbi:MAG: 2-oxoacid:acceptor oxidoreductase family protein [Candidatus Aminicenantes bacterium]|nr:2-oxoacid:acceptor oxidoreductase family protein [Candidatus Aminicenantes bacterium]